MKHDGKKKLLFFDWVVMDACNLNCPYCVNKGEYSQKPKEATLYIPGREIDIAKRIVELSETAECVVVNLTGGEPLLAKNIEGALAVLTSKANIKVQIITNFSFIQTIERYIPKVFYMTVSLHIDHRSDAELSKLVTWVNVFKDQTRIALTQVDHGLTASGREKLAKVTAQTGLPIKLQPFIPPWTKDGKIKNGKKVSDSTFVKSFGKRCALGYMYFLLLPNGYFHYGLWCDEEIRKRKRGDFLGPVSEVMAALFPDHMDKCMASSCGCNYNMFYFEWYKAACKKLGYEEAEVFGANNVKPMSRGTGKSQNILSGLKSFFWRALFREKKKR